MRQTTNESEVLVILDGKPVKGTIVEAFSPGAGRIQLGDKSTVQASYSSTGEEGTFHYPDEAKSVKQSETFGQAPVSDQAAKLDDMSVDDLKAEATKRNVGIAGLKTKKDIIAALS